jgi:hypothetical protein
MSDITDINSIQSPFDSMKTYKQSLRRPLLAFVAALAAVGPAQAADDAYTSPTGARCTCQTTPPTRLHSAALASADATRNATSSALRASLESSTAEEAQRNLALMKSQGLTNADQVAWMKASAGASSAAFASALTQGIAAQLWKDKAVRSALGAKGTQEALGKGVRGSIQVLAAKDATFIDLLVAGDEAAIEKAINGVGVDVMVAGAISAPETFGLGGLATVAGRDALMAAAPAAARGASTFIKGAAKIADGIDGDGSAAAAILGSGRRSTVVGSEALWAAFARAAERSQAVEESITRQRAFVQNGGESNGCRPMVVEVHPQFESGWDRLRRVESLVESVHGVQPIHFAE